MSIRIGSGFSLRGSFRSSRRSSVNLRSIYRGSSRSKAVNSDMFSTSLSDRTSYFKGSALSGSRNSTYRKPVTSLKDIKISSSTLPSNIADKNNEVKAVSNLKVINNAQNNLNESMPKWLKEAGVPEDVTFEFDYNIDTQKAEVTKISDENYRESVEAVINKKCGSETLYTAFASRIMNGYISSAYYPAAAKSLESCFGQDIDDLYLDKNGNIMGANANLQRALKATKNGREYTSIASRRFPAQDIEGLLKRLLSDKNITPNVSHMKYDGKSVSTDDGKFKLGKDFSSKLLNDKRYIMRGSIALYGNNSYDSWLENEKKF